MIKQPEYVFPVSLKGKYEYLQDSNRFRLSIPVRGYEKFVPDLIPNNGTTRKTKKENGYDEVSVNSIGKTIQFWDGFKLGRTDGPAYISPDMIIWIINGKKHRTDGPAVIDFRFNVAEYWIKGRQITKKEFLKHFDIVDPKENELSAPFRNNPIKESNASIRRNYQYFRNLMPKGFNWLAMDPNEIHKFDEVQPGGYTSIYQRGEDTFIFKKRNKNHREDGPAVVAFGRYISWWLNGRMHRTNGPALINFDAGWCSFYVNGKQLSKEEFLNHFDIDDKREKRLPDSLTILEDTNFEKAIEEVKTQRAKNWRGFDVDAQLKDEWLEDMNSFMTAYPISVCYGHPASENDHQGAGGPNAGINMRMDNTFRKGEAEDFESLCVDIGKALKGIPNTKITVALNTHENGRIPSRFVGSRVSENGRMMGPPDVRKKIKSGEFKVDTAVFHIICGFHTEGNEEKVDKWFESVVKTLKSVFI